MRPALASLGMGAIVLVTRERSDDQTALPPAVLLLIEIGDRRRGVPGCWHGARSAGASSRSAVSDDGVSDAPGEVARLFRRHDAVEVQLHFAIDHAAHAFDQAMRLVVFLAEANDVVQRHAGRHGERRLIDDLIAGVQLGHDEMARRAVGQHAAGEGLVIGANARESWAAGRGAG